VTVRHDATERGLWPDLVGDVCSRSVDIVHEDRSGLERSHLSKSWAWRCSLPLPRPSIRSSAVPKWCWSGPVSGDPRVSPSSGIPGSGNRSVSRVPGGLPALRRTHPPGMVT